MKTFSPEACWITLPEHCDTVNAYMNFRGVFIVRVPMRKTVLLIAGDSDFVAFLNNVEVGRGQYSDYPDAPTWSEFPLPPLPPGKHVLSILLYSRGEHFFTGRIGVPGVIAEIPGIIVTNADWRGRKDPAFRSGLAEKTTPQLRFTVLYDARHEDGWHATDFDASQWPAVQCIVHPGELVPRPVAPLQVELPHFPVKIVSQGELIRPKRNKTVACYAEAVASDFLSLVPPGRFFGLPEEFGSKVPEMNGRECFTLPMPQLPADGVWIIVDLGREYAGFLTLDFEAAAGTVADLSFGEHLADGRIRNKIGSRCFTDRYIARAGRNRFTMPFFRIGARYLQINFTQMTEPISLRQLTLRPANAILPESVPFDCADDLVLRLRSVSIRTLSLCMHEHYEDCPWREQALYGCDSRNQALYGYYTWGNWDFAAASFSLLGKGIRPEDGWLELCAPARCGITIPSFSLIWIMALAEHSLFSGNNALFLKFRDVIAELLHKILQNKDPESGLIRLAPEREIWDFYEWVPGLDGMSPFEPNALSAPFNFYCILALRATAQMQRQCGDSAQYWENEADYLAEAADRCFWSEENKGYFTLQNSCKTAEFHEHVQALALLCRIGTPARRQMVVNKIVTGNGVIPASLSALLSVVQALMPESSEARRFVMARIKQEFYPMLFGGADTLWETAQGERDFDGAGSLCHAWSALALYVQGAWQLGVQPLKPGFRRFRVSPVPDTLSWLSGEIPTPFGRIRIAWSVTPEGLRLEGESPAECQPEFCAHPETPFLSICWNGISII